MKKLRIPSDPNEAIAWAIRQKPLKWEPGEWLGRIIPSGIWSDTEPEELADQIVGAAVRGWRQEPPE